MKLKYALLTGCLCTAALFGQSTGSRTNTASAASGTPALRPVSDPVPETTAAAPAASANAATRIGIINIQEAIATTKEGQKAQEDLRTRFQPKQTELESKNKEIQSLQQKLQDGGNTLSPDAKAELARSIESKQKDYQRSAQDAQDDLNTAQNEVINQIGSKMMAIINDYAQRNGLSVVLDVSQQWPQNPVLFASSGVNITADIIRLYDQQHPVAGGMAPTRPATSGTHTGATSSIRR